MSRAVRGGLLAFSSAALAVSAHALGHGGLPDTGLTLLLTGLVGWVGAALAERTRGPLGLLGVLAAAQAGMHLVLGVLLGHGGETGAMLVAHAGATVVTAVIQAHAESMLRTAVARLRPWLPVVWRSAPVAAAPTVRCTPWTPAPPVLPVLLRRVHGRRGPPPAS